MMTEDEMMDKARIAYKMGKLRNQKARLDARRNHLLREAKRKKVHVPDPFISADELLEKYPDQFKAMPGSNGTKALFVGDTADDIVSAYINDKYPAMASDNKIRLWTIYANQIIGDVEGDPIEGPNRRYKKKHWITTR